MEALWHICISKLVHHGLRLWLAACSAPSCYLNQRWFIVHWTLENKFQWILNQHTTASIKKNKWIKMLPAKCQPFFLSLIVLKDPLINPGQLPHKTKRPLFWHPARSSFKACGIPYACHTINILRPGLNNWHFCSQQFEEKYLYFDWSFSRVFHLGNNWG